MADEVFGLDAATLHLGCKGRSVLLSMEGALHVSIHCDTAAWSRHFELYVGLMRDCIETGEGGSSEECVITTVKGDNVEDQVFTSEVIWGTEYYFQC